MKAEKEAAVVKGLKQLTGFISHASGYWII